MAVLVLSGPENFGKRQKLRELTLPGFRHTFLSLSSSFLHFHIYTFLSFCLVKRRKLRELTLPGFRLTFIFLVGRKTSNLDKLLKQV